MVLCEGRRPDSHHPDSIPVFHAVLQRQKSVFAGVSVCRTAAEPSKRAAVVFILNYSTGQGGKKCSIFLLNVI